MAAGRPLKNEEWIEDVPETEMFNLTTSTVADDLLSSCSVIKVESDPGMSTSEFYKAEEEPAGKLDRPANRNEEVQMSNPIKDSERKGITALTNNPKSDKLCCDTRKCYTCYTCGFSCKRKDHLCRHMRVHTGEKPYKCDICELRFRQNTTLKSHKMTHTGEKPYECNACKLRFRWASALKIHERLHTGEKPYECDVCQSRFRKSYGLKSHKKIHTGEKPYECDVCQSRFRRSDALKKHKRVHTGGMP